MLVGESDDINNIAANLIENAKRKTAHDNPAAIVSGRQADFAVLNDHRQNSFHFSGQLLSQLR